MRALTLWQPWADLVVWSGKDVENRTWPIPSTIDLPCRIAVHAGLSEEDDYDGWAWEEWRRLDLGRPPPAGEVVGTVDLVDGHHVRQCAKLTPRCRCSCHRSGGMVAHAVACCVTPEPRLVVCSRWADQRVDVHHWQLANAVPLDEPVPARGRQGLWTLPDDVEAAVLAS